MKPIRYWQIMFFLMAASFFALWSQTRRHQCPKTRPIILKPASIPNAYESRIL